MIERVTMPTNLAVPFLEMIFDNVAKYPIKTAAAYRNALLGDQGVFAVNPMLGVDKPEDIRYINSMMKSIVSEGKMIDFGYIPNEILKQESIRSRVAFESNELIHPYDNWCGISSWEGGMNGYFIFPNPAKSDEQVILETYGVSVPNISDVILVFDVISIKVKDNETVVSPLPAAFPQTEDELIKRGANCLDPLVTMLRLLADASVPVVDVEAPAKLNKRRAQQGKYPIPSHTVVETKNYVALMTKHGLRKPDQGGHHASPIAHLRRAHKRVLASGRTVPVRSSKVNWRETEEFHRLFYRIRENRSEK